MNLFPTEASRRRAARTIARVAGAWLVKFALGDDHGHVEIAAEIDRLRIVKSSLLRALQPIATDQLAPAFSLEVQTRSHLRRNVDYFLKQPWHHGLGLHPALDGGGCFQDLVCARKLPGFDPRLLKTALPRLTLEELLDAVDLPGSAVCPIPVDRLGAFGAQRIVDASAAALGVGPALDDRSAAVVLVRRAAAHLGDLGGIGRREIAVVLGSSARTVCRLAKEPIHPSILEAARRRLAIEEAVRTRSLERRGSGKT